jgi:PemK-like, MazF-like toxin of type II toxin-antitoxin system
MIGGPPRPGWVLRYAYDWSDPPGEGAAVKERPAVIVLSVARMGGRVMVRVAPITHRRPDDASRAIEISAATKRRLGLDGEKSWIILDHANEFEWPGPDVRPVPGRDPATIYHGPLPPALYAQIKRSLLALLRAGRVRGLFRRS